MMKKTLVAIAVLLNFASTAFGQEFDGAPVKILLPLHRNHPLPGAQGSLWVTDARVFNGSSKPVEWSQGIACRIPQCVNGNFRFASQVVDTLPFLYKDSLLPDASAALLYLDPAGAADVFFSLRVRDLSRERTDPGVEIPVVRESEALRGETHLVNIPASRSSRVALRLYDFSGTLGSQVRVGVFSSGGEPITSFVATLIGGGRGINDSFPPVPSVAEIFALDEEVMESGYSSFRIRLIPVDPTMRYWAFVTVTNNETQHVTLVTVQ